MRAVNPEGGAGALNHTSPMPHSKRHSGEGQEGQQEGGGFGDGERLDGAEADQSKPIHGNRRRASVGRRPNYAVVRRLPSYRCGTFPEQPTGFTAQTSDTARPYTTVGPKGIKGVTMGPIQSPAPAR